MKSKTVDPAARRHVLKAITVALPGAALAAKVHGVEAAESRAAPAAAQPGAPGATSNPTWQFFNVDEAALMDAIVARLIPADDLGPGAREAGATDYIDRQLAGAWGSGDNFYKSGPFQSGTPQQGYQLSYTPAQMFRTGLTRFGEVVREARGKPFAELDGAAQDEMLTSLEAGKMDLGPLPSAVFFGALMDATMEGFFCDPVYGGNRDMVGWKFVQFPGAYASYANDIERHGVAFVREPVSIANSPVHDMRMEMNHDKSSKPALRGDAESLPHVGGARRAKEAA